MADRADLIQQLAASIGKPTANNTEHESRFDSTTGTLYCDGLTISEAIADQAMEHFAAAKSKCNMHDPVTRQDALYYQCAIEAIQIMKNPKVKDFLKSEIGKEINS